MTLGRAPASETFRSVDNPRDDPKGMERSDDKTLSLLKEHLLLKMQW